MRFAIVIFMAVMVVYVSANVCTHDCGGHKGGNNIVLTGISSDVKNTVGHKGCDGCGGNNVIATGITNKVTNVVKSTDGHKQGCSTCVSYFFF